MNRVTLEQLYERKRQSDDDKLQYKEVFSTELNGNILAKKLPLRTVLQMIDTVGDMSDLQAFELNQELIYKSCNIFQNRELQAIYEVAEPYDVVSEVLNHNMNDIAGIAEQIMGFYGFDSGAMYDEVKNS